MTPARATRMDSNFTKRASQGRGVGVVEAVAAAEAGVGLMRDDVMRKIEGLVKGAQALRPTLAIADATSLAQLHADADAMVGLCALFGLNELGLTALSLCQLFDASTPEPPAPASLNVHLDAMRFFWAAPPEVRQASAEGVLSGLKRVVTRPAREGAAS